LGLNFRVRVSRNPCLKAKSIKKINKTNILNKIYANKKSILILVTALRKGQSVFKKLVFNNLKHAHELFNKNNKKNK